MPACAYCGSTEYLATDHVTPRSRGGSNASENLQTVCRTCNSMKGSRTDSEFREYAARKYGGIHDGRFTERRIRLEQDKWVDSHLLGLAMPRRLSVAGREIWD